MKVSSKKEPPAFEPVSLTITFDALMEIQAFHSIFNHTPTCAFLESRGVDAKAIREALPKNGYEYEVFQQYEKLFR